MCQSMLNSSDVNLLERSFSEHEVKQVVWECGGFKILGSNEINLGFLKDFQLDIKGDFTRFCLKFIRMES